MFGVSDINEVIPLIERLHKELTPQYSQASDVLCNLVDIQLSMQTEILKYLLDAADLDFDDKAKCKTWANDYLGRSSELYGKMSNSFDKARKGIDELLTKKRRKTFALDKEKYRNVIEKLNEIYIVKGKIYNQLQGGYTDLGYFARDVKYQEISREGFEDKIKLIQQSIDEIMELNKQLNNIRASFTRSIK